MQVMAFMWMRTVMNYQVKNGGSFTETIKKLWKEGGLARLYQGLFPWAIFQAPLSRFGDVAANDMVINVFGQLLPQVPVTVATFFASLAGAAWRICITPIDTCKTMLQTDGQNGMTKIKAKIQAGGITVLWHGWEGNYLANVMGNYPWFTTMNYLTRVVPVPSSPVLQMTRNAMNGAISSCVSDLVANSIRVIKTKKQTHERSDISYFEAAKEVSDKDGVYGIFFRGLETRMMTNIIQTAFFTVMWKAISGQK